MSFRVKVCKAINKLFPLPVHPFNLQNQGVKTYAEWQYEKGLDTLRFYLAKVDIKEMFENKTILDIGCGAAGKTLFYASQNVHKIFGIDVVERYRKDAETLAEKKGLSDKFVFVLGDAANLGFHEHTFDTIIMNDAMEHVDEPLKVLEECYRVLKPGGKLYLNFPPYYHPFGAHLSDAIGIPWVHLFFGERTLTQVYKELVQPLPDGEERIKFRISTDAKGNEYFSYINGMTVRRFHRILPQTQYKLCYYREIPLRGFLMPLARLPFLKEGFVKMVVGILEK